MITSKGVKRAKEVIKKKSQEFPDKFNKLILIWKGRFKEYQNDKNRS